MKSNKPIPAIQDWEKDWRHGHGVCEHCIGPASCPVVDMDIEIIKELLLNQRERILKHVQDYLYEELDNKIDSDSWDKMFKFLAELKEGGE